MNTPILNRAGKLPEDGWYQIEATGEHVNHAAKVVQVIDAKAIDTIVNRFNAAAQADPNFAGQRIDRDHLSQSLENPTEAFGWAMQLRNRAGIPEAKIDWTSLGQPMVEGKVYKFFSTEYDPAGCEVLGERIVNRKSYKLVRPLVLAGLALTNDPNNKGQKPISNRDGNPAGAADENQPDPKMNRLIKALDLQEGASEDSAVAALQIITNRLTKADGQVVALTKERDALLTAQVESDLEKYKNRFKPENKEKIKAALIANRASTIELLESTEAPAAAVVEEDPRKITNRSGSKTPEQIAAEKATATKDEERAAKISNRASQLRRENPRLALAKSYEMAEAEISAAK